MINPVDSRLFRGDGKRAETPRTLPASRRHTFVQPEHYLPDPSLVDAVNVALMLGQPLLLTGEPGTGKTQLAYYLAWELGLEAPLKYETKSSSTATSMFYTYDALRRFQDAQSNIHQDSALPYITYNALGLAILHSWNETDMLKSIDGKDKKERPVRTYLPDGFEHPGKQRSVVLIDEIDKAPRDVPNDILNEIDQMYFRVPELDNRRIYADPDLYPIVVLTSNSEQDLPQAFLRRCIFCHIQFPDRERMTQIVANRFGWFDGENQEFITDAVRLFYRMRDRGLRKEPATAELLDWVVALRNHGEGLENPLAATPEIVEKTLGALIKNSADIQDAKEILDQWLTEQQTR